MRQYLYCMGFSLIFDGHLLSTVFGRCHRTTLINHFLLNNTIRHILYYEGSKISALGVMNKRPSNQILRDYH